MNTPVPSSEPLAKPVLRPQERLGFLSARAAHSPLSIMMTDRSQSRSGMFYNEDF